MRVRYRADMAGANSGRGNAYQSKANPPRPVAKPAPPKPRSTLRRRSDEIARRYAEATRGLPDVPDEPMPKRSGRAPRRPSRWTRDDARDAEMAAAWKAHALTKAPEVVTPDGLLVPGDVVTREPLLPDWQAHHWLEASSIWAYRRELGCTTLAEIRALLYEDRNSAPLNRRTHERHTSWTERITREHVPADVWEFAAELDARAGRAWAVAQLERDYP